jgi:L-alanine-DL-glutamate epimerase-like enolase superfamily enzyme
VPPTVITALHAAPWNVELTEPFGIATGAQHVAANVLVAVTLADGTVGRGEAAPFPAVNGETQGDALDALARLGGVLLGEDAARLRHLSSLAREACAAAPSALAAIEIAALDAVTRRADLSLWSYFGGAEESLETDITIVTGPPEASRAAALRARGEGFRSLKVKVGGSSVDHDHARLAAILEAAPEARLVLDANAAFTEDEAVELVERVGPERIALFEQPVSHDDLDGMRGVRRRTRVLVAADESARSAKDVAALAIHRAADVVNVKITKCGLVEALDMIAAARAFELGLMIGGMVETELAMTVSGCLAAGQGGFDFVDLDTPFFMKRSGATGGMRSEGAPRAGRLTVSHIERGHGVTVDPSGTLLR